MIEFFPVKEKKFRLLGDQAETLNRLNRRTEESTNLTSRLTDKALVGVVDRNQFKVITSAIGFGAFCVMTGVVEKRKGHVNVEIHKAFRILFGVLFCLPVVGLFVILFTGKEEFSPFYLLVVVLQMLFIRFAFIGLFFRVLSKASLNRLRYVLDVEWV